MLVGIVVAVLNLQLQGSKLHSFFGSARVHATENRFFGLIVEQVDLDRVVSIDVLISEEEFLLEDNDFSLCNSLLRETLVGRKPLHCEK